MQHVLPASQLTANPVFAALRRLALSLPPCRRLLCNAGTDARRASTLDVYSVISKPVYDRQRQSATIIYICKHLSASLYNTLL